tara:strand:+ start:2053 stop:2346 length:294 start_codon:yes stop_codon:yes gene_type:complete
MAVNFTTEELMTTDCTILEQGINLTKFKDNNLPTDSHLIEYMIGGDTFVDIVRAYKKSDIFDIYFDKISAIGKIISIKSGFGKVRPNLYGYATKHMD